MHYRDLDIDRLHLVIEAINNHAPTPRRQGRTTAFIVLMSSEILQGDPYQTYVYVGENQACSQHVCMLMAEYVTSVYGRDVLTSVRPASGEIHTVFDQRFLFFAPSTNACRVWGTAVARVFCDVLDYEKRGRIIADLSPAVAHKNGDILY